MRMAYAFIAAMLLLTACAHSDVAANSARSDHSASGKVVTGSAGLQVNASGGLAAVLATGVIIAAAASEPEDSFAWPRFRSLSEWFSGPAAPDMDPQRPVSEQDCTRPVAGSGNLRCR